MKPKLKTEPVTELGRMLGTEDRGQHPARVAQLAQAAQTPTLTVTFTIDPRNNGIAVAAMDSAGRPLSFEVIGRALDAAREWVTSERVRAELRTTENAGGSGKPEK